MRAAQQQADGEGEWRGLDWSNVGRSREARKENVPGDFFVDHTCIGEAGGGWHDGMVRRIHEPCHMYLSGLWRSACKGLHP